MWIKIWGFFVLSYNLVSKVIFTVSEAKKQVLTNPLSDPVTVSYQLLVFFNENSSQKRKGSAKDGEKSAKGKMQALGVAVKKVEQKEQARYKNAE